MAVNTTQNPRIDYPDVLGTITDGRRLNLDVAQAAFAVYPRATAVGQPFEALVLLQNMIDKPIQITVNIVTPRKDAQGNRMSLITPKDEIPVSLQPGEAGLLHVPIVPHLPTQPSQNNTLGVQFQVRPPRNFKLVRVPHSGRAATALNMSPFRLNILREVGFTADVQEPGTLGATFSIIPGQVETVPATNVRYESLWTAKELASEQARFAALSAQAERFAGTISRAQVFDPLIEITEQRFGKVGLPLHPGEAIYIAKSLTYVMEDGLELEENFDLKTSRWFNRLASIINDPNITENDEKLVGFLYTGVVHDAVRLSLQVVERTARRTFGTAEEHSHYADEVVEALEGHIPIDLGHAYLPLILAGVILNQQIKGQKENLWTSIGQLREAWRGRQRLADSSFDSVNEMLSAFLYEAEQNLTRARIPRPGF